MKMFLMKWYIFIERHKVFKFYFKSNFLQIASNFTKRCVTQPEGVHAKEIIEHLI